MPSRTENPIHTSTMKAGGAVVADRFVSGPVSAAVQTGAAGNCVGVAKAPAATGEYFPAVDAGETLVEAGAAVADNDLVQSDADGRAITRTSTNPILGRARSVATAAGQKIAVFLIVN